MYDNQTRSMLQTSQKLPTVGSQTEGIKQNADGSYDIYFGPKPPAGFENNWAEDDPGERVVRHSAAVRAARALDREDLAAG